MGESKRRDPLPGDDLFHRGKKLSPETRAKIAAAKKAAWDDPETRAKMAAAQRGKKLSPETRAKISAAHRGKKLSPETRAKIAAAKRGKKHSPETRAKIAAARRGKKLSPETRAKIAAVALADPERNPRASLNSDQRAVYDKLRRCGLSKPDALCEALRPDARGAAA